MSLRRSRNGPEPGSRLASPHPHSFPVPFWCPSCRLVHGRCVSDLLDASSVPDRCVRQHLRLKNAPAIYQMLVLGHMLRRAIF